MSHGERREPADEASLTLLPLTSCCVAWFLMGRGPVPVCGPRGWGPLTKDIMSTAEDAMDDHLPSHAGLEPSLLPRGAPSWSCACLHLRTFGNHLSVSIPLSLALSPSPIRTVNNNERRSCGLLFNASCTHLLDYPRDIFTQTFQ